MTIPSLYQTLGLMAQISSPLWRTTRNEYFTFTDEIAEYSHQLALEGGLYLSADISLHLFEQDIPEWMDKGLGRHVQIYDGSSELIFEGFVNTMRMKFGTVTIVFGPMMDIANRVKVVYTPYIDISIDPPVTGNTTETIYAQDTDSHARYGIHEAVVDGGTLIDSMTFTGDDTVSSEPEAIRDLYLAENKDPEVSHEVGFERAEFVLKLECRGYGDFFEKHIYNDDTLYTVQVPTKIQSVVDANPNTSIFSTNYDNIHTEATLLQLTTAYEDQNRTAAAIIKELVSMGNSANDRTIFTVRENRKVYYDSIPASIGYYFDSNIGEVIDSGGKPIRPWRVLPGKWLEFLNLKGVPSREALRGMYNRMFLETVTYTAPFGLQLGGNKISRMSQLMAKKGTGV